MINKRIRVLIADDHDIYRDGLRMLLKSDANIDLVGEAVNGFQLIQFAEAAKPEIILTDLIMPVTDGITAIRHLVSCTNCKAIALSAFDNDHLILDAINAGALGYLLKNADRNEIITAIRQVHNSVPFYCATVAMKMTRMIAQDMHKAYTTRPIDFLSIKEKEIIRLICQEKSNEEIGNILFISKRTVEGIRAKIMDKINAKTTAGIVSYAIANSLFYLPPDKMDARS